MSFFIRAMTRSAAGSAARTGPEAAAVNMTTAARNDCRNVMVGSFVVTVWPGRALPDPRGVSVLWGRLGQPDKPAGLPLALFRPEGVPVDIGMWRSTGRKPLPPPLLTRPRHSPRRLTAKRSRPPGEFCREKPDRRFPARIRFR